MESGKILTALISGMAAGIVIGFLFAPDKGSETRKRIMDTASDFSDRIKSSAGEAYEKLNDVARKARNYETLKEEEA